MLPDSVKIGFRLSNRRIQAIWPGLNLIVTQHSGWQEPGKPGRRTSTYHKQENGLPKIGGKYSPDLMDEVKSTWQLLRGKTGRSFRVHLNAIQIRALMLALRIYPEYLAYQRRMSLLSAKAPGYGFAVPKISAPSDEERQRANNSRRLIIPKLEKYLKRANRRLTSGIGVEAAQAILKEWRAHLQWMRTQIVYFRPLSRRHSQRRQIVSAAMLLANEAIDNRGFLPPKDKALRTTVRLALHYIRRGYYGFNIFQLLDKTIDSERFLFEFVKKRHRLKAKPRPLNNIPKQSQKKEPKPVPKYATPEPKISPPMLPKKRKMMWKPHRKYHRLVAQMPAIAETIQQLRSEWNTTTIVEQSLRIGELIKGGCTRRGLAEDLGVSATTIRRRLEITKLSKVQQQAITDGGSVKAVSKQAEQDRIAALLATRLSDPNYKASRIRELADFIANAVHAFGISPRMYDRIHGPIQKFAEQEAKRLPASRWPKEADKFEQILRDSEPPLVRDLELRKNQEWIGIALARIEPDPPLVSLSLKEAFVQLLDDASRFAPVRPRPITPPERRRFQPRPDVPGRNNYGSPFG